MFYIAEGYKIQPKYMWDLAFWNVFFYLIYQYITSILKRQTM